MPVYQYRVCIPKIDRKDCPVIEIQHSYKEILETDPLTGYKLERIYTVPNLSKGYSERHTKKLLSDKNIEQHGFTKYVRDPISQCYVKTAGHEGPATFKALC